MELDLRWQGEKDVLKGRERWEPGPRRGVDGLCLGQGAQAGGPGMVVF